MSEYTREEILKMIEEVGGPQNLDLSGKDLSGIDLSSKAITKELEEYRKSNPDQAPPWLSRPPGINLYGAVLKETDLSSAHLAAADLWGADLKGASLRKADLEGACLVDAHLEEADLSEAHLERAYLRGVCIEEANIVEAYLEEANLEWAHLERADLSGAHLEKAHLGQAHLKEAILTEANLEKASLQWTHLEEATLIAAHLQGADLVGARLRGASLGYARLEGADLCEADLEGARLDGAHLEKVDLSMVESLAAAHFHGAWLDQTRMTKEQLGGAIGEEIRKCYYEANQTYLLLKNNFNQIGRYDDASSAYMKERQMGKMTYHPKIARSYYAKSEGFLRAHHPNIGLGGVFMSNIFLNGPGIGSSSGCADMERNQAGYFGPCFSY